MGASKGKKSTSKKPPFNLKVIEEKAFETVVLENNKGQIATMLYQCF